MKLKTSLVLVSVLLVLLLPSLAYAQECRSDFSFAKDSDLLNNDLTGLVNLLTGQGYYSVTVYGFASVDDSNPTTIAMSRAQVIAQKIFDLSDGKVTAIPQLGIADGKTDMFGPTELNQRVIVTSIQLFQEEYTPAPTAGVIDRDKCPTVLHCADVKLHKDRWYCMKQESGKDMWYGPCKYDGCIGDTEFVVLSSRLQTELSNVIGDDNRSIIAAAQELVLKADILYENGDHPAALDLYQQAFELYMKVDVDKAMEVKSKRDKAYEMALKVADSDEDARKIISVVKRSSRYSDKYQIFMDLEQHTTLRNLYEQDYSLGVYIFTGVISLLALLALGHIILLVLHRHQHAKRHLVDESADEILTDIEELEMVFKKKTVLADNNISKLRSLLKGDGFIKKR